MPNPRNGSGRPVGACEDGRVHTLEETGRHLHALGLVDRPLTVPQVYTIEQKALRKLGLRLKLNALEI